MASQPRRLVAYRIFTDGSRRPIFEDEDGQYVEDEDGCRVRGVWMIPRDEADESVVVEGFSTGCH